MTGRPAAAYRLQADGLVDPIGGTDQRPTLSWKLRGDEARRGFRVRAASSLAGLVRGDADLFDLPAPPDSGGRLTWPIAPLHSRQRVWWTVTPEGDPTVDPTAIAVLEAPLWTPGEWEAEAITHPDWFEPGDTPPSAFPELRTTFTLAGECTAARLYLTGAGVVVPRINESPAIAGQLEPGYSGRDDGTPASAWDVTDALRAGENSLGFLLGGGITYLPPDPDRYAKFHRVGEPVWVRARLDVRFADGTVQSITTGGGWDARLGPITSSNWYGGESNRGSAVSGWTSAAIVPDTAAPWWRSAPAVRVVESREPVSSKRSPDGRRIIDFGVNAAGRAALRLNSALPGRKITLVPSELLLDGEPDQSTTGTPIWDSFLPTSERSEWHPETVYHGGRYLAVTGLAADEADDAVRFEVLRAANERVGEFTSSDPFLSRLHTIIDRAVQSNMFSVFTDCPHREKLGWLEQLHYCFPVISRGYDVQAHLRDTLHHMVHAQSKDGLVPNTAPELVVFNTFPWKDDIDAFRSDPNWGRTIVELPWLMYRHDGDIRPIATTFLAMTRYLDYLESRSRDDLLDFGLGDWIEIDTTTPRAMVATHGWALALDRVADCADLLGERARAVAYRARADSVWGAFTHTFRDPATGRWGSGSEGSWALAWGAGRLNPTERASVIAGLLDAIENSDATISVGENSLPFLVRALTESGNSELLNRMIRRTDAPGYGHQIAAGATALTESWQGPSGTTGVASQNHFMLGVIDDWLVGDVAGLRQSADSVGWRKIDVRPILLSGVTSAGTSFDSPRGMIRVGWRRGSDGTVRVTIDVPPLVDVTVDLPPGAILVPA